MSTDAHVNGITKPTLVHARQASSTNVTLSHTYKSDMSITLFRKARRGAQCHTHSQGEALVLSFVFFFPDPFPLPLAPPQSSRST